MTTDTNNICKKASACVDFTRSAPENIMILNNLLHDCLAGFVSSLVTMNIPVMSFLMLQLKS